MSNASAVVENGSFLFRSLYLPYEVPHWLYMSKFTRLRASHGFPPTARLLFIYASAPLGIANAYMFYSLFLPRNALKCICAVLGSHVVRLSVCPSVTLVICDHIGWKSRKLIARTISPIPSLLVAERRSIYSQGTWRNLGET